MPCRAGVACDDGCVTAGVRFKINVVSHNRASAIPMALQEFVESMLLNYLLTESITHSLMTDDEFFLFLYAFAQRPSRLLPTMAGSLLCEFHIARPRQFSASDISPQHSFSWNVSILN